MGSRRTGDGQKRTGSSSSSSGRRTKRSKCVEAGGSGLAGDAHATVRGEGEEYGEENASTAGFVDDILIQVMAFFSTRQLLSKLAFVCRRWRRISKGMVTELLPPRVESPNPWGPWAPRHRFLELVERYKTTLERIELCGLQWLRVDDVAHIISNLPKLKDLTISSGFFPESADLVNIARSLPQQLLSLDLHLEPSVRALHPASLTVNDDFLLELQQRCILLQKLDLDGHKSITWQGLDGVVGACPMLTFLDVQSEGLGWPEVHSIMRQCKSLKHLSIVSPLLGEDAGTGVQAGSIVQPGRRLGFRSREGASTATGDLDVMDDVAMPPFLSSLRLYTSSHRSVKLELLPALGLLRKSGHQLRHLHAQGLFNSSWQTISVWCLNLVSLDLSHPKERSLELTEIEEIVLRGLVQLLKKLERLALPSATDRILSELGRCCPKLQEMRFQGHYLHCREIHPRPQVTNQGIIQLSEGCPELRVLSLAGCQNVTVSSARSLAFHCKGLEALYLSGCRNFTDDGVNALLPLMRKSLVALDLVSCSMVTPAIFTSIVEASESQNLSLRILAVSPTLNKHYQRHHRKQLAERLPFLRVVLGSSWDGFYHARYF